MEKDRGFKVLAVVALLIAVVGVSVGFASWSKTLNISTSDSNAVKDITDQFADTGLQFTSQSTSTDGATGTTAGTASGSSWSGMKAVLDNTHRKVVFTATVSNITDYNAYLKSISAGTLTCEQAVAAETATEAQTVNADLLAAVCSDVKLTVSFKGNGYAEATTATRIYKTTTAAATTAGDNVVTPADTLYVPRNTGSGQTVDIKNIGTANPTAGTATVTVTLEVNDTVRMPDADIKITIPTINFVYSSLKGSQLTPVADAS